ncbi:hypothetical protein [Anaeromyxobacter oryzae]|uniref:Lipoprotein n=1 Tax=Anaeromyxobacter oryzae TaxID=2918170 RepID=A0ABM7WYU0_9BACT|nr:hypothetical protein [Anaeromyxobacter oryzae]BDG04703.1 hypothetical protein AMOR_36990 [Anaeromyxobacter oryzae]
MRDGGAGRALAIGQGAFYLATGVWPLLDEASFEAVTGPKREPWLVKTVGVLVAAIGATLAAAGVRRSITPEVAALGAVTAAGIAVVEGWYAGRRRRISPIYLADAAFEAALAAAWGIALARRGGTDERRARRRRGGA